MCGCVLQITGEIERSDIPFEGDESFEGELSEDVSQDRDQDASDDLATVGQLYGILLLPVGHIIICVITNATVLLAMDCIATFLSFSCIYHVAPI